MEGKVNNVLISQKGDAFEGMQYTAQVADRLRLLSLNLVRVVPKDFESALRRAEGSARVEQAQRLSRVLLERVPILTLARPTPGEEKTSSFGSVPLSSGARAATAAGVEAGLEALGGADRGTVPAALVQRVVERVRGLAADLPAEAGPAIRDHGDLHLGQTVIGPDGWVVLDFEGEPARPLADRRARHSPMRDVAGLLRSLSYAAETVRRAGASRITDGWEPAARAAVLDGYLGTVDPSLLAPSSTTVLDLLALFELEKAVYEVGYELAHRPDWVSLPLAGLARTLGGVSP